MIIVWRLNFPPTFRLADFRKLSDKFQFLSLMISLKSSYMLQVSSVLEGKRDKLTRQPEPKQKSIRKLLPRKRLLTLLGFRATLIK